MNRISGAGGGWVRGALVLMCAVLGCQSGGDGVVPVVAFSDLPTAEQVGPTPIAANETTAPLVAQPGSRYPALFAEDSFAVLLDGGVLLERLAADAEAFGYGPEQVAAERQRIQALSAQFIICELHLASRFGDLGIAHDAVALRNMHVGLANDTGDVAGSAAVQLGGSEEIDFVDHRLVKRTCMALFPRRGGPGGAELLQPTTQRLRLTLNGEGSLFTAEWLFDPPFAP